MVNLINLSVPVILVILERSGGYSDCKGFWQQGHGGDWRLGAAAQQPSSVEPRQPDKCIVCLSAIYLIFDAQ